MPDTCLALKATDTDFGGDAALKALNMELDRFSLAIQTDGADAIARLAAFLDDMWDAATVTHKVSNVSSVVRRHPIMQLLVEDPFTRRSLEKPRGYAGDAVMLDYIYRPQSDRIRGIGHAVYAGTTNSPTSRSILWRQKYLGNLIARTAVTNRNARILSVASGHARELDVTGSLLEGTGVELTCLDSDAASLAEVCREPRNIRVRALNWSVMRLLKARNLEQKFSLIYSAGLCDYLTDKVLLALIRTLYRHLAPGGVLSFANFTPYAKGRGYLEFCMDWQLVYRSDEEMMALTVDAFPESRPQMFHDSENGVVYIEVGA